ETLQRALIGADRGLQAGNLFFQFFESLFHVLALDGIDPFRFTLDYLGSVSISIRRSHFLSRSDDRLLQFRRSALFAPQKVLVISRIDLDFAAADFKHSRRQLIDEIPIVRDEDNRPGVGAQGV